jgi:hypothetical protein
MTNFEFSKTRPDQWDSACERESSLFQSADWQQLLADCFGCRSVYAWDPKQRSGTAISLFRAGPFGVGYLGFPLGRMLGEHASRSGLLSQMKNGLSDEAPVCVRLPVSAFAAPQELQLPFVSTPETAIADLQVWGPQLVSTNIRRDLKKAARSGLELVESHNADDGATLFAIYAATVRRHKGSLRYNANYFSRLIELSQKRADLRVLLARRHREIAGFIVLAIDVDTAYYLHGGTNIALQNLHSSALLFDKAIETAKSAGLRCFNFMSSPKDQPTLVQYKEKWGGVTREHRSYVLALRPAYQLFRLAEKVYSWVR